MPLPGESVARAPSIPSHVLSVPGQPTEEPVGTHSWPRFGGQEGTPEGLDGSGGRASHVTRFGNQLDPRERQRSQGAGDGEAHSSVSSNEAAGAQVGNDGSLEAENWKQHLYKLLEDPDSSILARIISHCVLLTIILSILGFILQTIPALRDFVGFDIVEIGSTAIFTLEYLLRFVACNAFGEQTRLGFVKMPMNVLDILAILPFYVELCLESLELKAFRVLRSARLIRIFRIFKLSKYSLGMNLMVESLLNSVHPLSILAFFLCIGVLLFSALMYYAERTECPVVKAEEWQAYLAECLESESGRTRTGELCCNEHRSAMGFPSIRQTFWWSIVTMTTVGYGDMVPRTSLGRIVAGCAMVSGIVLISLPVAIVGAKFQTAYEEFELDREEALFQSQQVEESRHEGRAETTNSWKTLRTAMKVVRIKEPAGKRASKEKAARWESEASGKELKSSKTNRSSFRQQLLSMDKMRSSQPMLQALGSLTAQLKQLESRKAMSKAAQEQIQLLLELFEHVERAERQLMILREKDAALEVCIRADFAALMRRYDTCLAAELSSGS